jgi:hypothetical protein
MRGIIKEEFPNIINDSLSRACCRESWETSIIISILKIEKTKQASEYKSINMLPI